MTAMLSDPNSKYPSPNRATTRRRRRRSRTRSSYPPPWVPRFSNKLWLSRKRFRTRLASKTLTAPCFSLKNMSPPKAPPPMMLRLTTMTSMALTASLKLRADLAPMMLVTHSLCSKIFFFHFLWFCLVTENPWENTNFQEEIDEEDERVLEAFLAKDAAPQRTLADIIVEKLKQQDPITASGSQLFWFFSFWISEIASVASVV